MGYRNSAPSALAAAPTPGHNDGVDNRTLRTTKAGVPSNSCHPELAEGSCGWFWLFVAGVGRVRHPQFWNDHKNQRQVKRVGHPSKSQNGKRVGHPCGAPAKNKNQKVRTKGRAPAIVFARYNFGISALLKTSVFGTVFKAEVIYHAYRFIGVANNRDTSLSIGSTQ